MRDAPAPLPDPRESHLPSLSHHLSSQHQNREATNKIPRPKQRRHSNRDGCVTRDSLSRFEWAAAILAGLGVDRSTKWGTLRLCQGRTKKSIWRRKTIIWSGQRRVALWSRLWNWYLGESAVSRLLLADLRRKRKPGLGEYGAAAAGRPTCSAQLVAVVYALPSPEPHAPKQVSLQSACDRSPFTRITQFEVRTTYGSRPSKLCISILFCTPRNGTSAGLHLFFFHLSQNTPEHFLGPTDPAKSCDEAFQRLMNNQL